METVRFAEKLARFHRGTVVTDYWKCNYCEEPFPTESETRSHEEKAHARSCSACSKKFIHAIDIKRHQIEMHNEVSKDITKCVLCGDLAEDKSLSSHKMANHAFKCDRCILKFVKKTRLWKHMIEEHQQGTWVAHESLTQTVQNLTAGKAQLEAKLSALTTELEKSKQATVQAYEVGKIQEAELQKKMREQQTKQQQSMSAKSIQIFNLQNNVNALNKKNNEMETKVKDSEKLQEDNVKLMRMVQSLTKVKKGLDIKVAAIATELEASKQALTQAELVGAQELAIVKSALKTVNQTNEARVTEIESLKCQLAEKEEDANKDKATMLQLKKIGRMFREQKEEAEKKMTALVEEKEKLEEEVSAKEASETHKLLERINILGTEMEKLKAENEELRKTSTSEMEQAKSMKTALAWIQKTEKEKRKLELEKMGEKNSDKSLMDWG